MVLINMDICLRISNEEIHGVGLERRAKGSEDVDWEEEVWDVLQVYYGVCCGGPPCLLWDDFGLKVVGKWEVEGDYVGLRAAAAAASTGGFHYGVRVN